MSGPDPSWEEIRRVEEQIRQQQEHERLLREQHELQMKILREAEERQRQEEERLRMQKAIEDANKPDYRPFWER